jgi:hypothetical protein
LDTHKVLRERLKMAEMVHVRVMAVECLACMCGVVCASPEVHSAGFREVSWWLTSGGGLHA